MLLDQLHGSQIAAQDAVDRRASVLPEAQNGFYLTIESRPAEPLLTERLERRRKNIELLNVKEVGQSTTATLFVPESAKDFFEKTIEDYRTKDEPRALEPQPKGRNLVEGIGQIRPSALRDLWFDTPEAFPDDAEIIDWEVWLRVAGAERFRQAAREAGAIVGTDSLVFVEDVAIFVRTSAQVLAHVNDITLGISRIARARKTAAYFLNLRPADQAREIEQFLERVHVSEHPTTALCLLDTGVGRQHPILQPIIAAEDCHTYRQEWGSDDHHGHGTELAGISGYGNLSLAMNGNGAVTVPYVIESAKIHPPQGQNPYELYGAITAGGVARVELARPDRKRTFCIATTTDEDTPHRGKPTSWSTELDLLCFGSSVTPKDGRLFCISAGNIRGVIQRANYPLYNDLQEVESPAHCWNALCVGTFTEMSQIVDATLGGWQAFAPVGDLGPCSRTASWSESWPIKPDIVTEGGNFGVDPANGAGTLIEDLRLLTTSRDYPQSPFSTTGDTSASAANAARLCALVRNEYPNLWPETIRALVVDSAEWTGAMKGYLPAQPNKTDYKLLLRRFGFGVPDKNRALYSARNALTLVAEDTIRPFARNQKMKVLLNEMKLFRLPWPLEQLEAMGNTEVKMRVTLSYFIEPNPSETARNQKMRYASHGLRYAVKLPDEEEDEFRRRINKAAREEEGAIHAESDVAWTLGARLRDRGSLHSDLWRGPASDLARRGVVGVYPISGWWKERPHLERDHRSVRFALVLSITTPSQEVDIYTPVANQIAIQI